MAYYTNQQDFSQDIKFIKIKYKFYSLISLEKPNTFEVYNILEEKKYFATLGGLNWVTWNIYMLTCLFHIASLWTQFLKNIDFIKRTPIFSLPLSLVEICSVRFLQQLYFIMCSASGFKVICKLYIAFSDIWKAVSWILREHHPRH